MKKIYKHTSQAFIALGILLFTTSCGSDDKNDTPNEILQGLWRLTEVKAPIIADTSETTDTTITYPDSDGVQPYIRFNASTYDYFEVTTADTTIQETGNYTLANNEITILSSSEPAKNYGYTISGRQLIMIEKKDNGEITYFAEKVVGDPFMPETPADDEDTDNPDEEAPTGCAKYHDRNAVEGSSLNPTLIPTGELIAGTLYDVEGRNGHVARYYLQVTPGKAFRIHVREISTDYKDIISQLQYTTLSITDAYATDQYILNTNIETVGQSLLIKFDLFSTSSCLYIEFFSYQKEVAFKFEVENLSGTEE